MAPIDHLMLDGYEGSQETMEDIGLVGDITKKIANMVGTLTQSPYVIPYFDGLVEDDCGVSATAILEEGGHVTVHTFSRKATVFVDAARQGTSPMKTRDEIRYLIKNTFDLKKIDRFGRQSETVQELPPCFGPHYMVNGRLDSPFKLEELYDFIEALPEIIGMTSIAKPQVMKRNHGGMSGLGIIAESHIALHQNAEGAFNLDVFSCKPFNLQTLTDYLNKRKIPLGQATLIARGLQFPR